MQQQQRANAPGNRGAAAAQQPCVYLSNLPYEAAEEHLKVAFKQRGINLTHVEILKKGSASRRRHAGLAVATLRSTADARACETLDGTLLMGRPLIVRRDRFEEDNTAYGSAGAGDGEELPPAGQQQASAATVDPSLHTHAGGGGGA